MRSAAFVQLGCISLHSAANAAGIHLGTTFGQQFGDVLVGEGIPEIPTHAQNDQLSRVLAPFERIVQVDRRGILPYQDAGSEVRNGTESNAHGGGEVGLTSTLTSTLSVRIQEDSGRSSRSQARSALTTFPSKPLNRRRF